MRAAFRRRIRTIQSTGHGRTYHRHIGIDIATEIGMHVKHVQRPVRLSVGTIGEARVTALMYRPKLIGGERAQYLK